jgi:hypothetical protein
VLINILCVALVCLIDFSKAVLLFLAFFCVYVRCHFFSFFKYVHHCWLVLFLVFLLPQYSPCLLVLSLHLAVFTLVCVANTCSFFVRMPFFTSPAPRGTIWSLVWVLTCFVALVIEIDIFCIGIVSRNGTLVIINRETS